MKITDYKETFIDRLEYRIHELFISDDGGLENTYINEYPKEYAEMVRQMVSDLGYDPNLLDLDTLPVTFIINGNSHPLANQIYNEYESKIDSFMENEDYESEQDFAISSGVEHVLYMMGNPSMIDEVLKHSDELSFHMEIEPFELESNLAINNPESSITTIAYHLDVAFNNNDFEDWLYEENPDGYLDNMLHEHMREEQIDSEMIRQARYWDDGIECNITNVRLNVDLEEFAENHLDVIQNSGSLSNYTNQFFRDLFYQDGVDFDVEFTLDEDYFIVEE